MPAATAAIATAIATPAFPGLVVKAVARTETYPKCISGSALTLMLGADGSAQANSTVFAPSTLFDATDCAFDLPSSAGINARYAAVQYAAGADGSTLQMIFSPSYKRLTLVASLGAAGICSCP